MVDKQVAAFREPKALHDFKNHLSVIVGFSGLLLQECAADDPRRPDLEEIHKAAEAALRLLPEVVGQLDKRSGPEPGAERNDGEHPVG